MTKTLGTFARDSIALTISRPVGRPSVQDIHDAKAKLSGSARCGPEGSFGPISDGAALGSLLVRCTAAGDVALLPGSHVIAP